VAKLSVLRLVIVVAVGLVVLSVVLPLVAFGIVPLFVRSTVHEAAPAPTIAAVPVSETTSMPVANPMPVIVAAGMLRKVDAVHYGSGRVSILDVAGLDLSAIHSVAVWCQAFSVTVTYAEVARP
jgi:hypothetical protein